VVGGGGATTQLREVKTARSYLSQGSLELHLGLGGSGEEMPVAIVVRWPRGVEARLPFAGSGRYLVVEGGGYLSVRP
jgi:hypothetical protein